MKRATEQLVEWRAKNFEFMKIIEGVPSNIDMTSVSPGGEIMLQMSKHLLKRLTNGGSGAVRLAAPIAKEAGEL